jgi:ribose/xylose/arabinose/galactoside ABC-type transport system permease subunit
MTLFITNTKRFNYLFPDPGQEIDPAQADAFRGLANQALPSNFPMQAVWMIGIAVVFWFLMNRSLFGFRLKARRCAHWPP